MAEFSHTVEIPRPPAEVFPWLLSEDKVPQWTSHLERYERNEDGKLRQVLDVSGRKIDVVLEVTRHEPPHRAETRFSTNGIDVVSDYRLEPNGAGTRLTQSIDAKPTSLSARMLVPIVKPRLEQKVTEDLERLKETLSR